MAAIKLVDVSIRDGNQSLWGATGLNTAQMVQIAPVIDRVGFQALDFNSSTHMAVAVRYHREDPWQRIRLMHQAAPETPLQYITTGLRFISWETADPDFMRLVYRRLIENGMQRFIILDPMHDVDALLAAARIMRQEGARDIMGALTFTISAIHDDTFYANLAHSMARSADIDRVYIKDPAGILSPERARRLIPAVQAQLGDKPLELHSHCTIGFGPLNCMVAAELGIKTVHVAMGPLANGTSLPLATRIIANLREHGHSVDVDDRALAIASDYFARLASVEGLPAGVPQEYDAAYMRHQIPGGVMTTMRRQLQELKLEDRYDAVVGEVERVRADLGFPIMVTPFPQLVCTQALFNVAGTERYANVPDQVIRYVIGRFGRPTRPVDPDIRDRIMAMPRCKTLLAEPPPPTIAELRRRYGPSMSDDELLLRAVMPADQVDAMCAAPPPARNYNPDSRPLLKLLRGLVKQPPAGELVIEKPGFKLELRSK